MVGQALFEAERAGRELQHILEVPGAERVAALSAKTANAAAAAGSRRSCSLQFAFIATTVIGATPVEQKCRRGLRGRRTLPIREADASPEREPARPILIFFCRSVAGDIGTGLLQTFSFHARVAELVDAHDSKSCSARSGG